MKGLLNLWRNECGKIFRQTSNKVIMVIALCFAILTPLMMVGLNSSLNSLMNPDSEEYWQTNAQTAAENGDFVWYCHCSARAEAFTYFKECSISVDSWKYQSFFDVYAKLLERKNMDEFYLDGKITKIDFVENFPTVFELPDAEYSADPETGKPDDSWIDSFNAESDLEDTRSQISQLEEVIGNFSSKTYAATRLISLSSELEDQKKELSEKEQLFEAGKCTENDVLRAKLTVEGTEYMISFLEAIKNSSLDGEGDDWMVMTAEIIGQRAANSLCTVPVSEDEFNSGSALTLFSGQPDYESYLRSVEQTRTDAKAALETVGYSLSNGIQLPETVHDSTKTLVRSSLSSAASFIMLALVVITANNIAAEYTSGTIRLLLIRPRSRTKIILSKFLALLTTTVILSIASFILVNLMSILLSGVKDFFVPDLIYNGGVSKVASIAYSLLCMLLPLISGALLVALAFMMSVLTKKTALAIVVPLVFNVFGSILQYASAATLHNFPILDYTIFPYLDLSPFISSPVANFASGFSDGGLNTLMNAAETAMFSGLSAVTGVIVMLVHIAVMIAVGFLVFRRQQIKN